MTKDNPIQRKPQKALGWRGGGLAAGALCPVLGHWEEDGEDKVLWVDILYPQCKASPCALANLEACRLLLYLSSSHQLLSRAPKIAVLRKAL